MKTTNEQLKELFKEEKKVEKVSNTKKKDSEGFLGVNSNGEPIQVVITDFRKKTTEVTKNDEGVIVNKETGKPLFEELLEKKSRDINISLTFGTSAPTLETQLKLQGFKISKRHIEQAEIVRTDLLALNYVKILSEKQLIKCFQKLHNQISKKVIDSLIKDGETAIYLGTEISK